MNSIPKTQYVLKNEKYTRTIENFPHKLGEKNIQHKTVFIYIMQVGMQWKSREDTARSKSQKQKK